MVKIPHASIETYGKQNIFRKTYNEFTDFFMPQERWLGFQTYVPKLKKWKVGLVGIFCGICLITPATNWAIPLSLRWLLK